MRYLIPSLLGALALAGCSDSSDHRPQPLDPEVPPPVATELDDTGVYRGRIVTADGKLALVTVLLARDGQTSLAIETAASV